MSLSKSSLSIATIFFFCLTSPTLAEPIRFDAKTFLEEAREVGDRVSFTAVDLVGQSPQERTDPTDPNRDFLQPLPPAVPPREVPDFFPDIEETPPDEGDREGVSLPISRIEVTGSAAKTLPIFSTLCKDKTRRFPNLKKLLVPLPNAM